MKHHKPGQAPPNRVPIFDAAGNMRGTVGRRATPATVARITHQLGATLGRKNGRTAWLAPKPKPRPKPKPQGRPTRDKS